MLLGCVCVSVCVCVICMYMQIYVSVPDCLCAYVLTSLPLCLSFYQSTQRTLEFLPRISIYSNVGAEQPKMLCNCISIVSFVLSPGHSLLSRQSR